jgi:hypothetical protein
MNKDDIVRMAREAGALESIGDHTFTPEELKRFAALVAAAERERFAAECIDLVAMYGGPVDLEAAIRERGQA